MRVISCTSLSNQFCSAQIPFISVFLICFFYLSQDLVSIRHPNMSRRTSVLTFKRSLSLKATLFITETIHQIKQVITQISHLLFFSFPLLFICHYLLKNYTLRTFNKILYIVLIMWNIIGIKNVITEIHDKWSAKHFHTHYIQQKEQK